MINKHSFHIVDLSPWPLITSLNIINTIIISVIFLKTNNKTFIYFFYFRLFNLTTSSYCWWRDTSREGSFQGHHTYNVYTGLKLGILLFILREIIFFLRFFWRFFHFSLSPEIEISNNWPPSNITPLNPFQIPLLNTIILLRSGITVTWTHHSILNKNYYASIFSLNLTIILGLIFTSLQIWEYFWTNFNINDNTFGSIFFLATGFHGFHVILGTTFLCTNHFRLYKALFNNTHHFRFEAAAWYWHFVDVVWIFLYIFIYWWFFFLINIKSIFNFHLKSFN